VDFLTAMTCAFTRLPVDAGCAMSRARFSGRNCTEREGNVMDGIATVQDGPVLKIVVSAPANLEPHFIFFGKATAAYVSTIQHGIQSEKLLISSASNESHFPISTTTPPPHHPKRRFKNRAPPPPLFLCFQPSLDQNRNRSLNMRVQESRQQLPPLRPVPLTLHEQQSFLHENIGHLVRYQRRRVMELPPPRAQHFPLLGTPAR